MILLLQPFLLFLIQPFAMVWTPLCPQWFKAMRYESDCDHNHVLSLLQQHFLANLHLSLSSSSLASALDSSSFDSPIQTLDLLQAPGDGTLSFKCEVEFQCSSIDNFKEPSPFLLAKSFLVSGLPKLTLTIWKMYKLLSSLKSGK